MRADCKVRPFIAALDIIRRYEYCYEMETTQELTEALEDYLEAIYRIIKKNGAARVKDIAAALNVRYPSVTSALQVLTKRNLINYEPYGLVTLTQTGKIEASRVTEKHRLLNSFLLNVLGVDPEIADETACRLEHVIPKEVYVRLVQFIKYLHVSQDADGKWLKDFKKFYLKDKTAPSTMTNLDAYFDGTGFTMPQEKTET
jgi:DtxR family transcriptional regulator, Mn-dependent transcriptional regulator